MSTISATELADLFQSLRNPIEGYLRQRLHNREAAEDALQETFFKAYRAITGGTQVRAEQARAWLYQIATHTATDEQRRQKRQQITSLEAQREEGGELPYEAPSDNGELTARSLAEREWLATLLAHLKPHDRASLYAFEVLGYSCQEIGVRVGMKEQAVKGRLKRSRDKCRAIATQWENGRFPVEGGIL